MDLLNILKIIAALATVLTGMFAAFAPRRIQGFTGLMVDGGRGITEVRSIFGGLFIAVGLAPLFLQETAAFQMLGFSYLGIAAVRVVSIFVDRSAVQSNWISLAVEVVFGVLLIL